jgi:hypothetical protein
MDIYYRPALILAVIKTNFQLTFLSYCVCTLKQYLHYSSVPASLYNSQSIFSHTQVLRKSNSVTRTPLLRSTNHTPVLWCALPVLVDLTSSPLVTVTRTQGFTLQLFELRTRRFFTHTVIVLIQHTVLLSVVEWLSCLPLYPRFVGSNQAEDDGF